MARILPPFAALRAFEAAARHCSFKKASRELNLSPSAVSHQIRSLEDHLGVCLFHRSGSTLELTELAQSYRNDVATALNILEAASSRVETERDDAGLVINLFPSLVSTWLLPRLSEFKKAHNGVNIRIVSSFEPVPLTGSDIDLAIRYSAGDPPDAMSASLFEEEIVPVCSPAYLEQIGPIKDPPAMLHGTLIHCASHATEWTDWFEASGTQLARNNGQTDTRAGGRNRRFIDSCVSASSIQLESRAMALEAARNGLGLAMARTPFADEMLRRGDLVVPHDFRVNSGMNYYLCWPERKARFRNVVNFRNWLLASIDNAVEGRPRAAPDRLHA
jgi:LysR family glycine cleavage system transcriptional activator